MTDDEIVRALAADGMPISTIMDKMEMSRYLVQKALGKVGRPETTRAMFAPYMTRPRTAQAIADLSGKPLPIVRGYLYRMRDRGHVKRVRLDTGGGVWVMATGTPPQ